jgi:hypothetical protein
MKYISGMCSLFRNTVLWYASVIRPGNGRTLDGETFSTLSEEKTKDFIQKFHKKILSNFGKK